MAIEWSEGDGLFITVTEQGSARGIESVGLTYDELVRIDTEHSRDNAFSYEGVRYEYRNSYEAYASDQDGGDDEGFYIWEFAGDDDESLLTVVKSEGTPFEVYTPVVVAPRNRQRVQEMTTLRTKYRHSRAGGNPAQQRSLQNG